MRFHLSEEQIAIQRALRGTLCDVMPRDRMFSFIDDEEDFDKHSWEALMSLGLGGLSLPEEAGGSGLELVDLALAMEVLGEGAAVGPLMQHSLAALAINISQNHQARDKWLPHVASGEAVATLAWGGEWLPETWTVSVENGRANGEVRFTPGAGSANLFIVGTQGGGLALIEASDAVSISPLPSSDLTRKVSSITLKDAEALILFAPGDKEVHRLFDAALVLTAADALGGAQYCLDLSVSYAKEREQFGVQIGRFQALKHQLATIALEIEPARSLLWYAAYAWDRNLPDAARTAAIAKAHITDRYVSAARAAIAAHGGIGYTWEYGLNIWFRRSLFNQAYLGGSGLHRARSADLAGW